MIFFRKLTFSVIFCGGVLFSQTFNQDDSALVEFNSELLEKKYFMRYEFIVNEFAEVNNDTSGYKTGFFLNYFTPYLVVSPFVNLGLDFSPFGITYGSGVKLQIIDFFITIGYLGKSIIDIKVDENQFFIQNKQNNTHLGYLYLGYNFFFIKLRNYSAYGLAAIIDILNEASGEYENIIDEQIINNTNIDFLLFANFYTSITMKNSLNYKYFIEEEIYTLDYIIALENIFSFENFMEVGIVPKFIISRSSNPTKIKNTSSFFKVSPAPYSFLEGVSFYNTSLNGQFVIAWDLGYRIFPFAYMKGANFFKAFYLQPSVYSGWVIKENKSLNKSQVGVSTVLNIGYRYPYNSGKLFFGVGWNNYEDLILSFTSALYY